jgi:hypothetical protein
MAKRQPSYAWARHTHASSVPLSDLSPDAFEGLRYAEALADEARWRSRHNVARDDLAPLTLEQVADHFGVTVADLRRKAQRARRELFGTIGDEAILKRAQRQRLRAQRQTRRCRQARCSALLDPRMHASRQYCDQHRTPAARVRRHRARGA